MHFLQPHPFKNQFFGDENHGFGSSLVDAYDSAVAIADGYLPELRRLAREHLDPERPVYWVVMSDHGTGFSTTGGDAQLEEGRNIGEHFVHVPLIIAGPGLEGGRSEMLVSASIDTAATLLDLVGMNPPPSYDGVSLLPVLGGYLNRSEAVNRAVYLNYYGWHGMLHGAHKFVIYKGGASLVNLHEDPQEWRNIADTQPELVRELKALTEQEQRRIQLAFTQK
jgi:arylsulfatase A-like enzyme